MKHYLLIFYILTFLVPLVLQAQEDDVRIDNQYIVMLNPGHTIENLLTEFPTLENKECLSKRMNIFLCQANISQNDELLYLLRKSTHVKIAQYNHRIEERSFLPNDPNFNQQWNMLNTGQSGGTTGADIDATEAWSINNDAVTANGDTIVVAVVDGKPDFSHQDLNFFINYNEVAGNGIDDDANGYIDDVNGWNASNNSGDVQGSSGHATHIAGIVGAKVNDSLGVAGVCNGVKIMPVVYGFTIEANVVRAYDYVREMRWQYNNTFGTKGAYIVATNSSFGVNNGNPVNYPIWCAMYDSMGYEGIVSAGATANSYLDVDVAHDIPTECPSNYLVSVTNTTRNDLLSSGAAYGKISIDLGAPGSQVYSTIATNNYGNMSGTSMATPHVAGVVAAMYAAACKPLIDASYEHPDSIALLIRSYLLDGTEWVSSMNGITSTNGRLNYYRAIQNLQRYNCDSCNFSLNIAKDDITCQNLQDGNLTAIFSPGNFGDYYFLWSNGFTVPGCVGVGPGFYTVTLTDTLTGCSRYFTEELHNPDLIVINSINTSPALNGNNGTITINASAGGEPLLYSMDGVNYQVFSTFSITTNGNYTVYVKNTSGCVEEQTVFINSTDELQISNYQLRVSPNPANEEIEIICDLFNQGKLTLQVLDATGKKVTEITSPTSGFKLQVSNFENGVYFLKAGSKTSRVVIVH